MSRATVLAHLRRYPWWYTVAAVWVVAMLSLPVVRLDPLGAFGDDGTAAPTAGGPSAGGPAAGGITALPPGLLDDVDRELFDLTTTTLAGEGPTSTAPPELELVPPEVLDALLDALPPIVFPPLPEELRTLAAGIAPIASFGCSGLGLASLVVSVVTQTVEGVPLGRLLPYLTPVSAACASFPIPEVHTVCAADEPLVIDLGGVTTTPPIIGLGIDQLDAIETLMESTYGVSVPKLAPELRELLTCRIVDDRAG
jgi:hypothetical protein